MKKSILISTLALVAGTLLAADPKADVTAAAKKLAAAGNYSWKSTMDMGANSQFTPGPTEGKTDKDGYSWLSNTFNDQASEGIKKGDKVAAKTDEGWKSGEEITAAGGGFQAPGGRIARTLQTFKAPATEVEDLVAKAKDLKVDGDAIVGDLNEEGAKAYATMGGRGRAGAAPVAPTDAKASVKFWLKDGSLAKYSLKVSGKRTNQNGEAMEFERTTTTELKDVGTTKLTIPDDAKKKVQ